MVRFLGIAETISEISLTGLCALPPRRRSRKFAEEAVNDDSIDERIDDTAVSFSRQPLCLDNLGR